MSVQPVQKPPTLVRLPSASLSSPTSSLVIQARSPTSAAAPALPWGGCGFAGKWADASPTFSEASPMAFAAAPTPQPAPVVAASNVSQPTFARTLSGNGGKRLSLQRPTMLRKSTADTLSGVAEDVPTTPAQAQAAAPIRTFGTSGRRWADLDDTPMATPVAAAPPVLSRNTSLISAAADASPTAAAQVFKPVRRWADLADTPLVSPMAQPTYSFGVPDQPSPLSSPRGSSPPDSEEDSPARKDSATWKNYPTSPINAHHSKPQARGTEPRIGIDIGGVLTREGDPTIDRNDDWDLAWEAPGAFNVVWQITQVFGPDNVFIVSKVRPGSSMQMQIEHWLHETCKFCEITGVLRENIVFVASMNGPEGKGVAASKLGLSHFVDDKLECLESVFSDLCGNSGPCVEKFQGILFHFAKGGYGGHPPRVDGLQPRMQKHYCGVANWDEVQKELRLRCPERLKKKAAELLVASNVMQIDPTLQRGLAAPLFASHNRAAEEKPPWFREANTLQISDRSGGALQWTASGRPKLQLKPRTNSPATAPEPVAAGSPTAAKRAQSPRLSVERKLSEEDWPSLGAKRTSVSSNAPQLTGASPKNARVISIVASMSPPNATSVVASSVGPTTSIASTTLVASTAVPAVATKPSVASQPAVAASQSAALQKDPAGGRPKLMLKPRSTPQTSTTSFLQDLNQKLQRS